LWSDAEPGERGKVPATKLSLDKKKSAYGKRGPLTYWGQREPFRGEIRREKGIVEKLTKDATGRKVGEGLGQRFSKASSRVKTEGEEERARARDGKVKNSLGS